MKPPDRPNQFLFWDFAHDRNFNTRWHDLPYFHAGNDKVTLAAPLPASRGTHTGPWNSVPQQRAVKSYRLQSGCPPRSLAGNSISTAGCRPFGTTSNGIAANVPFPDPVVPTST